MFKCERADGRCCRMTANCTGSPPMTSGLLKRKAEKDNMDSEQKIPSNTQACILLRSSKSQHGSDREALEVA